MPKHQAELSAVTIHNPNAEKEFRKLLLHFYLELLWAKGLQDKENALRKIKEVSKKDHHKGEISNEHCGILQGIDGQAGSAEQSGNTEKIL